MIREVDRGEPILVREVEFMRGESLKAFEMRMHKVEHEIIVTATGLAIRKLWEERRKDACGSV